MPKGEENILLHSYYLCNWGFAFILLKKLADLDWGSYGEIKVVWSRFEKKDEQSSIYTNAIISLDFWKFNFIEIFDKWSIIEQKKVGYLILIYEAVAFSVYQ